MHEGRTPTARPAACSPILPGLLRGYRFGVCEDPDLAAEALAVRRRVYVETSRYRIAIPDEYDLRSWLLFAQDVDSGSVVGSIRITPRYAGRLEAEEYFALPAQLASPRAAEISRFAILPPYRRGTTFLPVVSMGLFKLVMRFLQSIDAHYMVICARPERLWTFEWMRFTRTGMVAHYGVLANTPHELLWYDFRRAASILEGHPFRDFFVEMDYAEVLVPPHAPPLGLPGGTRPRDLRRVRGYSERADHPGHPSMNRRSQPAGK